MGKPKLVYDEFMTPAEVGEAFNVDPKTVGRWAKKGLLPFVRTGGGHRRYPRHSILELFGGEIPKLYAVGDVAKMFKVDPKTVARWDKEGKIRSVRTPGNHRRVIADQVDALLTKWRRD